MYFFSSENKNLFKNLSSLTLLINIYARTCLGQLGKMHFFTLVFLL